MAILLSVADFPQAKRIACNERPLTRAYWSWREIDHKKCWYEGRAGLDKHRLYWPSSPQPIAGRPGAEGGGADILRQGQEPASPPLKSERPVEATTGELVRGTDSLPAPTFEQMWRDMLSDLARSAWYDPMPLSQQRLMIDWQFWSVEKR
ncbi:MAG: hypothetical protein C5B54_04745 [Acidobacteria bacterium]|nr:MAG: hypothetical protein C5B54_04745 [Acidobacteriota bacterium]